MIKDYFINFVPHTNEPIRSSLRDNTKKDPRFDKFRGIGCAERVATIVEENPYIVSVDSVINILDGTMFTLDDFIADKQLLAYVAKRHPYYTDWFISKFPNGAKCREEVLNNA